MNSQFFSRMAQFVCVLHQQPHAAAEVLGSPEYPNVRGRVYFYQTRYGVIVSAEVFGLPEADGPCRKRIFAFHIHSGSSCTGNQNDPFADAGIHYNPGNCEHPNHDGDLPPLWGNDGYAFTVFLTNRFTVNDIIGKTVVIHANPDDLTSQPAGNAGQKIACGVIEGRSGR